MEETNKTRKPVHSPLAALLYLLIALLCAAALLLFLRSASETASAAPSASRDLAGSFEIAVNNGGITANGGKYADEASIARAAREGDRYARMLENARVHDSDGFLLDGENASYRTY